MSCSLSLTECFGRYAWSVCHCAVDCNWSSETGNWPAGTRGWLSLPALTTPCPCQTGSRPSFGLHNLRLFSSCYLFTFQPVSFGIFTSCLFGPSSCGRCSFSRFFFLYLFFVISFASEYLLLISTDMAFILLSRSCLVAASCCRLACEFK